jgi:hypothetical protein
MYRMVPSRSDHVGHDLESMTIVVRRNLVRHPPAPPAQASGRIRQRPRIIENEIVVM